MSTIKRKVRFPGTSPKFQHNGFGSDSRNVTDVESSE